MNFGSKAFDVDFNGDFFDEVFFRVVFLTFLETFAFLTLDFFFAIVFAITLIGSEVLPLF